jgi:hypothetical protein
LMTYIFSLNSCATVLPPSLAQRTLYLSDEKPVLFYNYEVCVSRFIVCTKKEIKREYYDLNDVAVRKQLIAMGFVFYVKYK